MSARAKRSVTRRRHREVQSSGLLLTWDGEEGGKRRREGGREEKLQDGLESRRSGGGEEGSHPSLHMSCFIPGVPPNIFQRVPHVFHKHHILSRSPSHSMSALLLYRCFELSDYAIQGDLRDSLLLL